MSGVGGVTKERGKERLGSHRGHASNRVHTAAQRRGSRQTAGSGVTEEGGVEGGLTAENWVKGSRQREGSGFTAKSGAGVSPRRAGTRRRAPPARSPGTPEPSAPGAGGRRMPAPARTGEPGSGWAGTAELGWGQAGRASPRTRVRPARSPRRLRLTELPRGRAHFRVSGAILGEPAHFRSCRGAGPLGRGVVRGGTIPGGPWPLSPLRGLGLKGRRFESQPHQLTFIS